MKKILLYAAAAVVAAAVNLEVSAETTYGDPVSSGEALNAKGHYKHSDNGVHLSGGASKYTTVLIAKCTGQPMKDDDIVYAAEKTTDAWNDAMDFMLRADADAGYYAIILGDGEGNNKENYFVIGAHSAGSNPLNTVNNGNLTPLQGEEELTKNSDGTYRRTFATDASVNLADVKSIVISGNDEAFYQEISLIVLTGEGSAKVAVQIVDLPAELKDKIENIYLCSDTWSREPIKFN